MGPCIKKHYTYTFMFTVNCPGMIQCTKYSVIGTANCGRCSLVQKGGFTNDTRVLPRVGALECITAISES